MGDRNQLHYLRARIPEVDGPVLEIGSKEYGGSYGFRGQYPDFTGLDMAEGQGVDVVCDLSETTGPLQTGHYALIICCSVLEHCAQPWNMADNIVRLLKPGGRVYVCVPWTWRYHPYPDDYWRFSWSGIKALFPWLEWNEPTFSTTREGEFLPAEFQSDNNLATVIDGRKFIPYLMLHMIGTWTEKTK